MSVERKTREEVPCPECDGTGSVWATFVYGEVQADCPFCGGSRLVFRRALEQIDYPGYPRQGGTT